MTLEEAIQQANQLAARQEADGPSAVSDAEIMKALDDLRTARAASATSVRTTRAPAQKVNLDEIF